MKTLDGAAALLEILVPEALKILEDEIVKPLDTERFEKNFSYVEALEGADALLENIFVPEPLKTWRMKSLNSLARGGRSCKRLCGRCSYGWRLRVGSPDVVG